MILIQYTQILHNTKLNQSDNNGEITELHFTRAIIIYYLLCYGWKPFFSDWWSQFGFIKTYCVCIQTDMSVMLVVQRKYPFHIVTLHFAELKCASEHRKLHKPGIYCSVWTHLYWTEEWKCHNIDPRIFLSVSKTAHTNTSAHKKSETKKKL